MNLKKIEKKSNQIAIILIFLLTGCIGNPPEESILEKNERIIEPLPGVYLTNDINVLPLPTSGYDIYIIGEEHGIHEIKCLFMEYLQLLHETTTLQNVILEKCQFAEKEINDYILGKKENIETKILISEVIPALRTFNNKNKEKIHAKTPDVCGSLDIIHEWLSLLKKEIGSPAERIQIPSLADFKALNEDEILALIHSLIEVTDNESILNELRTIEASIRCRSPGELDPSQIREETIARNVLYILHEQNDPVLALYGWAHAQKNSVIYITSPSCKTSWGEQVVESGASVYSLHVSGIKGEKWELHRMETISIYRDPEQLQLNKDTTLADILENAPEYNIVYIDLRVESNKSVKTGEKIMGELISGVPPNTLLADVFDGLIFFKEVTPAQINIPEDKDTHYALPHVTWLIFLFGLFSTFVILSIYYKHFLYILQRRKI